MTHLFNSLIKEMHWLSLLAIFTVMFQYGFVEALRYRRKNLDVVWLVRRAKPTPVLMPATTAIVVLLRPDSIIKVGDKVTLEMADTKIGILDTKFHLKAIFNKVKE